MHDETPDATFDGNPLDGISRATTPLPDPSRTLRRTMSYASIDTVRPSGNKGIRRCIEEIAENLKKKSTKKRKKESLTINIPKNTSRNAESNPVTPLGSEAPRYGQTTTPPSQLLRAAEEKSVLSTSEKDHATASRVFELGPSPVLAVCKSDSLMDVPLFKEESWKDYALPVRSLQPGAHVAIEPNILQSPCTPELNIKDLRLNIRSSETDMTIWDGLQVPHHVFKCRLFLQCIAHPYDSVAFPDVHFVEIDCNTRPAGSRYAKPAVLLATYEGAAPNFVTNPNGLPNVSLEAGIHIDRAWYKIQNNDGSWGWYRDAFVPLSPRLFDKVDYREFKLTCRVWLGESSVEDELTFGISMLLREVDMK